MDIEDTPNNKALQAKLTRLEKKVETLNKKLSQNKLTIEELTDTLQQRNEYIQKLEQTINSAPYLTAVQLSKLLSPATIQQLPQKAILYYEVEVVGTAKRYLEQAQTAKDHYLRLTLDKVDQKVVTPAHSLYEQTRTLAIDLPIHWQNILQHKVIDPSMHQINTMIVYAEDFYHDNLNQILALIDNLYKTILVWIEEVKAIVRGEKPLDLSWLRNRMQGAEFA